MLLMVRYTVLMDNINTENETNSSAIPAAQPAESSTPEQLAPVPFKLPIQEPKEGKGKLIAIILAVMLVFGGGGTATAYYLLSSKPAKSPVASQSTKPTEQPVKLANAKAVVDAVKEIVKSPIVKTTMHEDGDYAVTTDEMAVYSYPFYQVAGYDFVNLPETGHGMTVSTAADNKESIDEDIAAITMLLEKNEFKLRDMGEIFEQNNDGLKINHYVTTSVTCATYWMDGSIMGVDNHASISCADIANYTKSAKDIVPFYDKFFAEHKEYIEQDGEEAVKFVMSKPRIGDGMDGYKNARLSFATKDSAGMVWFYRVPGKDWQYLVGTSSLIPVTCDLFDTVDSRKAFVGTYCYDRDTDKDSTVKV